MPGLYLWAFLTPPFGWVGTAFLVVLTLAFFFGVLTEADFLAVVFVRAMENLDYKI